MPWKFENNQWFYQLDFEKFTTNIDGKLKQVSIKNIFEKIKGSYITTLDFWTNKWNDYYNYYFRKFNTSFNFIDYILDYKTFNIHLKDFYNALQFNQDLIEKNKEHGKFEIAKQSYESIKYIVEHLRFYKSPWLALDSTYKKPIKKHKNIGKNIVLRNITLPNRNLGLLYLNLSNSVSQPVKRRGRPRKSQLQVYHPDLYGFP